MKDQINGTNAVVEIIAMNNQIEEMKAAMKNMVMAIELRVEILAELAAGVPQIEEHVRGLKADLVAGLMAFSYVASEDEVE